jgi:hypothetical protein
VGVFDRFLAKISIKKYAAKTSTPDLLAAPFRREIRPRGAF